MTNIPPPLKKTDFLLNPEVIFLNHGSFGATPRQIFDSYQKWQRVLEYQPVEFLGRKAPGYLRDAREKLSLFLGTKKNNLVFVTNTTIGINTIARGLQLNHGDEVLSTDHEYGAMNRVWKFLSQEKGIIYKNMEISLPMTSEKKMIDELWNGVTQRTKVIYLSHISSPTAIIFPIKKICERANNAGILTIIDGAHAPGQIDLNLDDLGADFYTGNLHKWLCAPKGSAFLYAKPDVQPLLKPLIVSWGWEPNLSPESIFVSHLEQNGTRDISSFLTVPDAIRFYEDHHWPYHRENCHKLAVWIHDQINLLTNLPSIYSNQDTWFSQMACCELPGWVNPEELKTYLYEAKNIEVPIVSWNNRIFIRFSIQVYNTMEDAAKLVQALKEYFNVPPTGRR